MVVGEKFPTDAFNLPERFAAINRLILKDLNGRITGSSRRISSKDEVNKYLANPDKNIKQLRDAVNEVYNSSSHFRRLIQYFANLNDLAYVVSPYRIEVAKANKRLINKNYKRTLDMLSTMDIKNQFRKILTVCLREDIFYGTMWVTKDNITIQQLPSDYCDVSVVEGNVLNVTFNFSYFDLNPTYLPNYPQEFREKYEIYKATRGGKWIELDSPTSFAIKCNTDILAYPIPPFAGILREVYDIEDYKKLKFAKTELENYAMLVMSLPSSDEKGWRFTLDEAVKFYHNLDEVLPDEVGSVLSPMKIEKIGFGEPGRREADTIAEAEESLFTAAGVSSLLFNNEKASSNALLLSVKADQAITYGIVCSIEQMVNRYLWSLPFGKNFKVTFLDTSSFNRKEVGDAYLKACQYGFPMVSYYCASQGLMQADMDCLNFLEDDILGVKGRFIPVQSSNTQSSKGDSGRPQSDIGDLSESGEQSRELDE